MNNDIYNEINTKGHTYLDEIENTYMNCHNE